MEAYKVFTHDLRPPIRGGEPVITGPLPFRLPAVTLDMSASECGPGWNASRTPEDALRIAGFWPDGRPSRLFRLTDGDGAIERGNKVRARAWTVVEEIIDVAPIIHTLSTRWFGMLAAGMAAEQLAWREALARPKWSVEIVETELRTVVVARGLEWAVKRFASAREAWAAWAAWAAREDWGALAAWAAWDAWEAWETRAAWAAWAAWDARDAWAARDAWETRDAWAAWDARAARDARDAWAARDALTVSFSSRSGWTSIPADRLTIGIRDAYRNGLTIALPTAPNELGWAMIEAPSSQMASPLDLAILAGYADISSGAQQVRRMAREGRLPGAKTTTSGWQIPRDCVPIIIASRRS